MNQCIYNDFLFLSRITPRASINIKAKNTKFLDICIENNTYLFSFDANISNRIIIPRIGNVKVIIPTLINLFKTGIKFEIINSNQFSSLKNYSQKSFCEIVCVCFSDLVKRSRKSLKKVLQSIIYARGHKSKNYLIDVFNFCVIISQKTFLSIRYLSDNYKFMRGVVL